jgi:uncharacterized protein (TIGR04255 family)
MHSRRHYANPPLVEALCQFKFQPGREWDNTVPGLLYAAIRDEYPERRQKKAIEVLVNNELAGVTRSTVDKTQFVRADGSAMIQVGTDTLVINMLRPYGGWEQFRAAIRSALTSYNEVASPDGLVGLALRYINRIVPRPPEPGSDAVDSDEYITFSPKVPRGLPQILGRWTQSIDIILPENAGLRLTSGTSNQDQNLSFVLDIEAARDRTEIDRVDEYLEEFHQHIEQAFESCITENSRALFEEEVAHERVG